MQSILYHLKSTAFISILFLGFFLSTTSSQAAEGDTTNVIVHDAVDMVWNENYDLWGLFPDGSKTYRKITLYYTLGCSSAQCSDWDYTTQIFIMPDTSDLSNNLELGRVITPYGGYMADGVNGFNNNWNHTYTFDVTDFAPVLKNNQAIRAYYDGWSDGFSVSLRFEFIEGTPPREVKSIQNLYHGRANYNNWISFDINQMPDRNLTIPADVVGARARVSITGHGFTNNVGCAEFCERSYSFEVDNNVIATQSMWRGDCGLNPIYPQGGTWIYNRADWCPGDKSTLHIHELTPYINTGGATAMNMDLQNYAWAGDQAPYYIYDVQTVYYGAPSFNRDVEIIDIISPSNQDPYSRMNPICGKPKIKVRNSGANPATSISFHYGVTGGPRCEYTWTGTLNFMEETEVDLPSPTWAGLDENDPRFEVTISTVNGSSDEYASNDWMQSAFTLPPTHNSTLILLLATNNAGAEYGYTISDSEGNVLSERATGTMGSNTLYRDTMDYEPGCYTIRLTDSGGDGLSWWNNSDGDGSMVLRNTNGFLVKSFQADFGSEVYYQFSYGDIADIPTGTGCFVVANEDIPDLSSSQLNVLPNPNSGEFSLAIEGIQANDAHLSVVDLLGKIIYQEQIDRLEDGYSTSLSLKGAAKGIYLLRLQVDGKTLTKKVVVQ